MSSSPPAPPAPGDLDRELRAARQEIEHLRTALASNRRIGVAVGILVARRGLTEQQAVDLLKTASQRLNRRVRDLAEEVIYLGDIAGPAGTRRDTSSTG
jgi:AmiR/NasT family two-component response regulator